jgi:uncharacterized oxidoreductase
MGVEFPISAVSTPTLALIELLAIRLSPQAGKSLVIPLQGGGNDDAEKQRVPNHPERTQSMLTNDHIVLVTGGATGIGFALAEKFHSTGNRVILAGRSIAALRQAASQLPGVETCVADISLPHDRSRLILQYPDVSILINNAGIQINKPLAQMTAEEVEHELNINFLAPVLLTRGYLPHLMSKSSAAIINVSSGLALVPKEVAAIYCASKAALHSVSKTLRWQLEKSPVRVFEVMPPLVETAMTAGRGKGKISAEQLAEEFWRGFVADRYEMQIGKTKLLSAINRLAPSVADRIMRHGL